MRLDEAYGVLGLRPGCSDDDVKRRARELMKCWHPDVCSDPDAAEKFKRVNEAVERIKAGDERAAASSPFDDLGSIFSSIFGGSPRSRPGGYVGDVVVSVDLTFEESVLGTTRTLSYDMSCLCPTCGGSGEVNNDNGCGTCGGSGSVERRAATASGHVSVIVACPSCGGRRNLSPCTACGSSGRMLKRHTQEIRLRGGVHGGETARVRGAGHEVIDPFGLRRTDLLVRLSVTESATGLRLVNDDVHGSLKLSLLDALTGCTREVQTINGPITHVVPPGVRNHDNAVIAGLGVPGKGNHVLTYDVEYPGDTGPLIRLLSERKTET